MKVTFYNVAMRNRTEIGIRELLPLPVDQGYALGCLFREPQDAYELSKSIKRYSRGDVVVVQANLTNALYRLKEKGLVEQTGANGKKKLYGVTALGKWVLVADTRRLLMRVNYINEGIAGRQKNK